MSLYFLLVYLVLGGQWVLVSLTIDVSFGTHVVNELTDYRRFIFPARTSITFPGVHALLALQSSDTKGSANVDIYMTCSPPVATCFAG